MKIINTVDLQRSYIEPISFVPTMGALHEGHLSLVQQAKEFSDEVWMSIYVNELQFNNTNDFDTYPRDLDQDISKAEKAGVDVLFVPEQEYLHNGDKYEKILSGEKGSILEGSSRPGHFDGVLTIVNRFLSLTFPRYLVLGQKDAQQYYIIKDMLSSKFPKTRFISAPIVRDNAGLALSSRNILLKETSRNLAAELFNTLKIFGFHLLRGDSEILSLSKARKHIMSFDSILLDYLVVVDAETFESLNEKTREFYVLIAATIDGVRLIDNIRIEKKSGEHHLDLGLNLLGEEIE